MTGRHRNARRPPQRSALITAGLAIALIAVGAGADARVQRPDRGAARAATGPRPVAGAALPLRLVRLRVATLGIDAPVVDVGLTADRQLQVPTDPQVLGRWAGGAEPGEPDGGVVIAGHVDDLQVGGALFQLRLLAIGDEVVAVGADGRTRAYQIVLVREVAKQRLAPDFEPFRQDVPSRLVLVTCGGAFDPVAHSYADSVVVYAVPAAAEPS